MAKQEGVGFLLVQLVCYFFSFMFCFAEGFRRVFNMVKKKGVRGLALSFFLVVV